jgi:hypothetical protein
VVLNGALVMPALEISHCLVDVGRKRFETCRVRIWPNAQHGPHGEARWEHPQARQLAQLPFQAIASDGRMLEPGNDEANAHSLPDTFRTCERGSGYPDLDVLGPNALPLSRDALNLRTPRYSCCSRKAE